MVMASCVAVLFGDKIRSQSKPFLYLFQFVAAKDPVHDLGLRVLAELLGKNPDGVDLRKRILKPLVNHGALQRAYPNPNDKRQAYTSCSTPIPGKIEQ